MGYCRTTFLLISPRPRKVPLFDGCQSVAHLHEGDVLEDPVPPEEEMWRWTVSPESALDQAEELTLTFERGDVVAIDGHRPASRGARETQRVRQRHWQS